jgi:hypothetical protein
LKLNGTTAATHRNGIGGIDIAVNQNHEIDGSEIRGIQLKLYKLIMSGPEKFINLENY